MYLVIEPDPKQKNCTRARVLPKGQLVAKSALTWNVENVDRYKKMQSLLAKKLAHSYVLGNVHEMGAMYALTMEEAQAAATATLGPEDSVRNHHTDKQRVDMVVGIIFGIAGLAWVAMISLIKFGAAMAIVPFALWLALRVFRRH